MNKINQNPTFRFFSVHDASAKIPSGILSGNVNQFGDFDECLQVAAPNNEFNGKYCLAYVEIKVPDYLPQLRRIRKLLQAHDAFVNDFDDVSVKFVCKLLFMLELIDIYSNYYCFTSVGIIIYDYY